MSDTRPDRVRTDTVVLVGHARLPQSLSSIDAPVILVELEVERETGLILDLDISGALPAARRLLVSLLVGKDIGSAVGPALRDFKRRYVGPPQKAISTALSAAHESYERHSRQRTLEPFPSSRPAPWEENL